MAGERAVLSWGQQEIWEHLPIQGHQTLQPVCQQTVAAQSLFALDMRAGESPVNDFTRE